MLTGETHERLLILFVCFLTVLAIVIYGTIRCKGKFVDPLTKSFVGKPWDSFLDGWGISHFLFYMALGYYFPHRLLFLTTLGVLWELIESLFKEHPFYLSKCHYKGTDREGGAHWWYGRWQDVIMNTLGLLVGALIASHSRLK